MALWTDNEHRWYSSDIWNKWQTYLAVCATSQLKFGRGGDSAEDSSAAHTLLPPGNKGAYVVFALPDKNDKWYKNLKNGRQFNSGNRINTSCFFNAI